MAQRKKRATTEYLTLSQLCEVLSISQATGRNWVRLGRIVPGKEENGIRFFEKAYVEKLRQEFEKGTRSGLRSRRNKKFLSGNRIYEHYLASDSKNVLALHRFIDQVTAQVDVMDENMILQALALAVEKMMDPNDPDLTYIPGEDLLGMLYLSLRDRSERKASGSYYTPSDVVRQISAGMDLPENGTVLDPACGTGSFLLQLPNQIRPEQIYGCDIDEIAVKITRYNLALRYPEVSPKVWEDHIICTDYLFTDLGKFDRIIGNPPWGSDFSEEEKGKIRERFLCAGKKSIEASTLFLEKAMQDLNSGGRLSFVVPEAVLSVQAHRKIRSLLMEEGRIRAVTYLGETFSGVQCPSVILFMEKGEFCGTKGICVTDGGKQYRIETERPITAEYFNLRMTDEEYRKMEKIRGYEKVVYLKDHAEFALGIVTGNNREMVSDHALPGSERVLIGADLNMYRYEDKERYLVFAPEKFQQVAPERVYRAPEKLVYRFISDRPVVAYDNRQRLTLNSANILIPRLDGLDMKYIMAWLNSDLAAFYYRKEFGSVKVLKSHLEKMPIPVLPENIQRKIVSLTETGDHDVIEAILCKYLHL